MYDYCTRLDFEGVTEGIKVIYVIDVYLSGPHSKSWVFDTGFFAHICNSL